MAFGVINFSLPPVSQFQCFCAKNWKETIACRVYGEPHSSFPFDCSLSQVLRAKRLLHGVTVSPGSQAITVRERSFLDNPNVPDEVKVIKNPSA